MVFAPMRLDEHAVDLFEIDNARLVADGLDEGGDAEIFCASQKAFAGAHDEGERFGGERVVTESDAVHLGEQEGLDGFGREAREHDRVRHARADLLVLNEGEGLQQRRLREENKIVRAGKILEEQPQFAQGIGLHEVRVIDDRDE